MKTIKLFGVAGAGKTTKCLELIKQFIAEGYSIEDIGFTTYTTAGIRSIEQKLEENNIFLPEQNSFRTLHSLSWRLSGLSIPLNWRNFCKEENIDYDTDEFDISKSLGKYIEEAYEKIQNIYVKDINNLSEAEINELLLEIYGEDEFITADIINDILLGLGLVINYKNKKQMFAYSDALIKVVENKIDLPVKILIVDEAQDLFPAQIKIIELWTKTFTKDIYVLAGDDDQCIHEWAGSKPDFLIETAADEEILLEKSYRCPKIIAELANKTLKKISYRKQKTIHSDKTGGKISLLRQPNLSDITNQIDQNKNTYLLFRTNKIKNLFATDLFQRSNVPFSYIDNRISPYSLKFINIHNAIIKLGQNQPVTFEELCDLIKVIKTEQLQKGIKTTFKKNKFSREQEFSKAYFLSKITKWGLLQYNTTFDLKEYILLHTEFNSVTGQNQDKKIEKNNIVKEKILSSDKIIKFKTFENKKNVRFAQLPVALGTFHSSKGLEAEDVFVFLGTSKFFNYINDSEYRCLYVALTRSCNNLYLIDSWGFNNDYSLFEAFYEIYKS